MHRTRDYARRLSKFRDDLMALPRLSTHMSTFHPSLCVCARSTLRYMRLPGEPDNVLPKVRPCLDLVSISVDSNAQNLGICSTVLHEMQAIASASGSLFMVECVSSPILRGMLERRGFLELSPALPDCYLMQQ